MLNKGKKWLCLLGWIVVLAGSIPAMGQFIPLTNDCNANGVGDECDLDCNAPDCNTNDCGSSTDCRGGEADPGNPNGEPDKCDPHTFYYVDVDAVGNSNGLSWADAYVDLKLALDDINANMPCGIVEIWVAHVYL